MLIFLLDILLRHALETVDYVRLTFYPDQLLDQYEAWWSTRRQQKYLNFLFIVLSLCSLALQYLPTQLREHIENELGDDVQLLTKRYHKAARQLSDFSALDTSDLIHVQQPFLTAAWFKGEGFYTKAWHCLGAATREAQELSKLERDFPKGCHFTHSRKAFTAKFLDNESAVWTVNVEGESGAAYILGPGS